jgi:hypothetical protein
MDASWATLKNEDGTVTFFETAMGKKPYYFRHKGTPDNPLKTQIEPFTWDYNGYNKIHPSGCWLDNIYKVSKDTLIGFIHREDLFVNGGNGTDSLDFFYLGIARSFDGGNHWKYLGDVVGTIGNLAISQVKRPNIAGLPILIVGDYIHLYYDEVDSISSHHTGIAVARTKLNELIRAIKQDKTCAFVKYNNGNWSEDAFTGVGSNIIPDFNPEYDVHSDAVYCKPLDTYLLTVQTHRENKLLLYQSSDGINWGEQIVLDEAAGMMHPYSTFVGFNDEASDDCNSVGSEFYLYINRKSLDDYEIDEMYYQKLTIK